jgi:hypothetical protein
MQMINDEKSSWLRALQRGTVTQERYDKIMDELDEREREMKNNASSILVPCEWCESVLESVKTLQPNKDNQFCGYCPHCKTDTWSKPVSLPAQTPADATGEF